MSCAENDVVAFEHWMHTLQRPRATVVALHGFTMGQPRIDGDVLWRRIGLPSASTSCSSPCRSTAVGRRARRAIRASSSGSWHVGRLNEAVRQAIHDVHLVRTWLAERGAAPVGVLGLSLGGHIAALYAGLCGDLALSFRWRHLSAAEFPIRLFGQHNKPPVAVAELQAAYRVHWPLTHLPIDRTPSRPGIGGRGDQVVPLEHAQALWRHWREPASYWYTGSHSAPFRRARITERVTQHLAGLGLVP